MVCIEHKLRGHLIKVIEFFCFECLTYIIAQAVGAYHERLDDFEFLDIRSRLLLCLKITCRNRLSLGYDSCGDNRCNATNRLNPSGSNAS
jgi:hypothetical protein